MVAVWNIDRIVKDLKDILAQGAMNEATRTALEYNVLKQLEYAIDDHYAGRAEALLQYLAEAEGVEIEDISFVNVGLIDFDYWVDEIEENSFDAEMTYEPARRVLEIFKERGYVTINDYVEDETMEQGNE